MKRAQTNTNKPDKADSIFLVLFPALGPTPRAFLRGILFGWIPVLAAFPIGFFAGPRQLIEALLPFVSLLALPTFVLSFAFIRTEPRLSLLGFGVLLLLLLCGLAFPTYAE